MISGSIQEVMPCHNWRASFFESGLMGTQARLRTQVLDVLGLSSPLEIAAEKPTSEQLAAIFPARANTTRLCLFPGPVPKAKAKAKAAPKAGPVVAPAVAAGSSGVAAPGPISRFTRSQCKL